LEFVSVQLQNRILIKCVSEQSYKIVPEC
jgi:hypothetical protein